MRINCAQIGVLRDYVDIVGQQRDCLGYLPYRNGNVRLQEIREMALVFWRQMHHDHKRQQQCGEQYRGRAQRLGGWRRNPDPDDDQYQNYHDHHDGVGWDRFVVQYRQPNRQPCHAERCRRQRQWHCIDGSRNGWPGHSAGQPEHRSQRGAAELGGTDLHGGGQWRWPQAWAGSR